MLREGVRLDRRDTALLVITTTETVVFQLLRQADTDDFRVLAPLLR